MTDEVQDKPQAPEAAAAEEAGAVEEAGAAVSAAPADEELEQMRRKLAELEAELERTQAELKEAQDRYLRALAEVQTVRRRVEQDVRLAREQGADSVILSVLPAYDDLKRALEAAVEDPAQLIPGIEKVREGLRRNLEGLGIVEVGQVGEDFNPEFHEALTAQPTDDEALKGKIAQVFESGFVKDGRVVRVARVVVYQ